MAVPTKGRKSASREEAAAILTKGTWEGTLELVTALTYESMHTHGFRPIRAAALAAARDAGPPQGQDFMSGAEFARWWRDAKALAEARSEGDPLRRIGISAYQARGYCENGASKIIALACAHYLMDLPMPIEADDPRAFDIWFAERFGGAERVAEWLGVKTDWISVRRVGFEVIRNQRYERAPSAGLIRALDWLSVVGPVCPYGAKAPLVLWPGQDLSVGY